MNNFYIGEIVKSTRSWTDFIISKIYEPENMLVAIDGRAIKFDEAHRTGRHINMAKGSKQ